MKKEFEAEIIFKNATLLLHLQHSKHGRVVLSGGRQFWERLFFFFKSISRTPRKHRWTRACCRVCGTRRLCSATASSPRWRRRCFTAQVIKQQQRLTQTHKHICVLAGRVRAREGAPASRARFAAEQPMPQCGGRGTGNTRGPGRGGVDREPASSQGQRIRCR